MTSILQNNLSIQDIQNITCKNDFIVPFKGKYEGKYMSDLVSDTNYFTWCMQQPNLKKAITNMYNITINNSTSTECSKTPNHNRLQNLFLDEEFCKTIREFFGFENYSNYKCEFEGIFNWDVIMGISKSRRYKKADGSYEEDEHYYSREIFIEIKPILGDDYPNVLRKMKQQIELTRKRCGYGSLFLLLVENYSSDVTTKDQLVTIFKQADIKVKFLNNENKLTLKEENKMLKERIKELEEELKIKK